ncbi:hypothetical protein A8B78_10040 [Jannaschia sp. EhC01]|nr:hypothetical protein A8B78_10040 [Jannaschia sp. EhC01]
MKARHKKLVEAFTEDIPYLTKKDKFIPGYLRHHKQKRFAAERHAGHARTLFSKGYIYIVAVKGQQVSLLDVPFEVASHVWEVVESRPEDFPHKPERSKRDSRIETHPWRERRI